MRFQGWHSSLGGDVRPARVQRRHGETQEEDDEEAQEVAGNSISPRANTTGFASGLFVMLHPSACGERGGPF